MIGNSQQEYLDTHASYIEFTDTLPESRLHSIDFGRLQQSDFVLSLLMRTIEVRRLAISHRNFLVSAGALACSGRTFGRAVGYNVKPWSHDAVNIHAEELVGTKLDQHGYDSIAVVCVVGEPQADKVTNKRSLTLPPCGQRCRPRFAVDPRIKQNTLFLCASADLTAFQFTDMYGLLRWQEYEDDSHVTTFEFPERPEILRPIPKHYAVLRPEDVEVPCEDWDSSVSAWLNRRHAELYGVRNPADDLQAV